MMVMVWILVALAGFISILVTLILLSRADSAIQETTAVGIGLAVAIIPYIIARSFDQVGEHRRREQLEGRLEEREERRHRRFQRPPRTRA